METKHSQTDLDISGYTELWQCSKKHQLKMGVSNISKELGWVGGWRSVRSVVAEHQELWVTFLLSKMRTNLYGGSVMFEEL